MKKGYIDNSMVVNAKRSFLMVGENVVVCPTEADQAMDRQNKYFLGLNIGKIVAINHELQQVQLWWFYGKKWNDDSWFMWVDPKTKSPYKQWMSVDELAVDDIGRIVRVTMEPSSRKKRHSHYKLSVLSVKTIKLCHKLYKHLLFVDSAPESQVRDYDTDQQEAEASQ